MTQGDAGCEDYELFDGPLCVAHERPLIYVAYPDEQMVGERICPECEEDER